MSGNDDNFGGTKLVAENGERMDPALAGISPPAIPTMQHDAAGAADPKDDEAGQAEARALMEEDVTDASPTESGDAVDESEAQPS